MNEIWIPVLLVAGIGLIAGLGLAIASIVMAVPKDEKAEAITEMLPGANCGACGYSGCAGYAAALSKGEAKPGLCAPGGAETAAEISEFLGLGGGVSIEKKVALVHCMGSYDVTSDKMEYQGIQSCAAAALLAGGITSCQFGCMGLGDCAKACPYGAIEVCNGMARVDPLPVSGLLYVRSRMPQRTDFTCPLHKTGCSTLFKLRQRCRYHESVQDWLHWLQEM